MRTTLNLDDSAVAEAMKLSDGKTKTEVINDALREYVRRRRVRSLLKYEGKVRWRGDLDELRKRKRKRK